MDVNKFFQKLENKLLKKDKLTVSEKKLLERIKNKDIDLIIELLMKKLQKLKNEIDKLYDRKFDKSFTEQEEQKLDNQRKKIISIVKEYNSQKIELKSSDFSGSKTVYSFGEIIGNIGEKTKDTTKDITIEFGLNGISDFVIDSIFDS